MERMSDDAKAETRKIRMLRGEPIGEEDDVDTKEVATMEVEDPIQGGDGGTPSDGQENALRAGSFILRLLLNTPREKSGHPLRRPVLAPR